MQILKEGVSLDEFFDRLSQAAQSLLMLDYDGTLAPFVVERDEAVPYPGIRERLDRLMDTPRTRLVLVSGRDVKQLRALVQIEPGPEIFGCHGAERFHPRTGISLPGLTRKAESKLHEILDWAKHEGLTDRVETKPTSIAFHVRGLAEDKGRRILDIVSQEWQSNISTHDLEMHDFDGGVEIRLAGVTKGDAVSTLLDETSQAALVAYLGDDKTDEDAFAALGDRGLKVLVRDEYRDTLADIRIKPPEELIAFLDRWHEAQR